MIRLIRIHMTSGYYEIVNYHSNSHVSDREGWMKYLVFEHIPTNKTVKDFSPFPLSLKKIP